MKQEPKFLTGPHIVIPLSLLKPKLQESAFRVYSKNVDFLASSSVGILTSIASSSAFGFMLGLINPFKGKKKKSGSLIGKAATLATVFLIASKNRDRVVKDRRFIESNELLLHSIERNELVTDAKIQDKISLFRSKSPEKQELVYVSQELVNGKFAVCLVITKRENVIEKFKDWLVLSQELPK